MSQADPQNPSPPPAGRRPGAGAPDEHDDSGVDLSLIRANLRLTPVERARRAERQRRAALRVQQIGRHARAKPA